MACGIQFFKNFVPNQSSNLTHIFPAAQRNEDTHLICRGLYKCSSFGRLGNLFIKLWTGRLAGDVLIRRRGFALPRRRRLYGYLHWGAALPPFCCGSRKPHHRHPYILLPWDVRLPSHKMCKDHVAALRSRDVLILLVPEVLRLNLGISE